MKADPNACFLAEELSDLYFQSGRLREAVQEAEEAIKQNPNDVNARRILGRMYTRMIGDAQQGKVNQEMLQEGDRAVRRRSPSLNPKDIDSLLTLGGCRRWRRTPSKRRRRTRRSSSWSPDNEDALTGLAIVYADLGDSKRAAELLQRVIEKSPVCSHADGPGRPVRTTARLWSWRPKRCARRWKSRRAILK